MEEKGEREGGGTVSKERWLPQEAISSPSMENQRVAVLRGPIRVRVTI